MASRLGIIAGAGALPRLLIEACRDAGRPVFVLALKGDTEPETTVGVEHAWCDGPAVGQVLQALRRAGCDEIVLAGRMGRPDFRTLSGVDKVGRRLLPRLVLAATRGDDAIIQTFIRFFQDEGFRVVGAETVLPHALAPAGGFGAARPSGIDRDDIDKGREVVRELGRLDIGQACVVRDGHVLAVEAAEGTDLMLQRCAGLPGAASGGVLVKLTKPGQQRLADLPTIGPQTVAAALDAGLNGIAVEARATLLVEREALVAGADAGGLFLVGVER